MQGGVIGALNVPHLSIARLVFHRAVKPDREHPLRYGMPTDLAHVRRDAGEADTRCRIMAPGDHQLAWGPTPVAFARAPAAVKCPTPITPPELSCL
jgi:hypothetical protein